MFRFRYMFGYWHFCLTLFNFSLVEVPVYHVIIRANTLIRILTRRVEAFNLSRSRKTDFYVDLIRMEITDWPDSDLSVSGGFGIITQCANHHATNSIGSTGNDKGLTREHRFVSTRSPEDSGTDWCHQAPVSLLGGCGGQKREAGSAWSVQR